VRLDPVLIEQLAHLGKVTAAVAEEPARIEIEPSSKRSIMRLAASTPACRIAVVASASTMIAFSTSIR